MHFILRHGPWQQWWETETGRRLGVAEGGQPSDSALDADRWACSRWWAEALERRWISHPSFTSDPVLSLVLSHWLFILETFPLMSSVCKLLQLLFAKMISDLNLLLQFRGRSACFVSRLPLSVCFYQMLLAVDKITGTEPHGATVDLG